MPGLNRVEIIGNIGRPPEMRFTPNGNPVTSFSVAVNRVYTNPEGEKKEEVEWFNVVCWQKLAETVNQYCTKGQLVFVEGRFQTRSWQTEAGETKYRTELVANRVLFLSKPGEASESAAGREESAPGPGTDESPDLPF